MARDIVAVSREGKVVCEKKGVTEKRIQPLKSYGEEEHSVVRMHSTKNRASSDPPKEEKGRTVSKGGGKGVVNEAIERWGTGVSFLRKGKMNIGKKLKRMKL